jgi:serine/threonine-protein kinase
MHEHDWKQIQALFDQAVELSPDARSDYLDEACGEDQGQRRVIEKMLKADAAPPSLLDAEPGELATLLPEDDDELPTHIGPYQVEKLIGRGGMGIVLLAHRPDLPRKVALKLVRDRWVGRRRVVGSDGNRPCWRACSTRTSPGCWMPERRKTARPT